jgi:hypothetical protein
VLKMDKIKRALELKEINIVHVNKTL